MKVAITGHEAGVGQAIAAAFRARGAEVVGLSRSNGYDSATQRGRIVEAAAGCDVFVNNPHEQDAESQLQLLFKLVDAWKGQDRTIVNLASRAGDRYLAGCPDPHAVYMRALDAACQQLFNRADQRPRVVNVRADEVTGSAASPAPSLSPEDVARAVIWVVDQPRHVYIASVTLAHHVSQGR